MIDDEDEVPYYQITHADARKLIDDVEGYLYPTTRKDLLEYIRQQEALRPDTATPADAQRLVTSAGWQPLPELCDASIVAGGAAMTCPLPKGHSGECFRGLTVIGGGGGGGSGPPGGNGGPGGHSNRLL